MAAKKTVSTQITHPNPVKTAPVPVTTTPNPESTVMPEPPNPTPLTVPAPATTSSPVVLSTTPPVLDIPAVPAGFTPVKLSDYRGSHAKATQVAALPDAVVEIKSSATYPSTFGSAMPEADPFVRVLTNADGWTGIRMSLEAYLVYAKTQEAEAWRTALVQIDQATAVFEVTENKNPDVAVEFPALARLLGARQVAAKKAAATRKRNKATNAAQPATAPAATAAPAATSPNATAPAAAKGGPAL